MYSGKYLPKGLFASLILNRSTLFKKRIKEVFTNHLELQMESNSVRASVIRFYVGIKEGGQRVRLYDTLQNANEKNTYHALIFYQNLIIL